MPTRIWQTGRGCRSRDGGIDGNSIARGFLRARHRFGSDTLPKEATSTQDAKRECDHGRKPNLSASQNTETRLSRAAF
jgi:hypothetical protein